MKNIAVCIMAAWWFAACGNPVTSPERVDEWPDIYPDYIGVTIPATIAPMNFNCIGGAYERVDVTVTGGKSGEMHVMINSIISARCMARAFGGEQG